MKKYTEAEKKAYYIEQKRKRIERRKAREAENKKVIDTLNFEVQYYRGLRFQLVRRGGYQDLKAKRYYINGSRHMIWIPNCYLNDAGIIVGNIDWILRKWDTRHKIELSIKEKRQKELNNEKEQEKKLIS